MKAILVFVIMVLIFICPLLNADKKVGKICLPPIETLKELPLELVADFAENEDIAIPSSPIMTEKGDLIFFDTKLHQVSKTHINTQEITAIGGQGEGPGEYIWVTGICADGQNIYITDRKRKLLCFDLNGKYKWETRTGNDNRGVIGVKGETFYFEGIVDLSKLDKSTQGIFEFQKGKSQKLLVDEPLFIFTAQATVYGKKQGTSIIFVGTPAMRLNLKTQQIVTAASRDFHINFFDLQGKKQKTIKVQAPKPQFGKGQEKYSSRIKEQKYAIMDLFCHKNRLIVISNYFKDDKPRVDFFNMAGKPLGSFLMPFQIDNREAMMGGGKKTVRFTQGYVIYKDTDYSGFKIYRPKITL